MSIPIPDLFSKLVGLNCIAESDIVHTADGFQAVFKSLSDILKARSIECFEDSENKLVPCNLFFDDWYLYALPNEVEFVYGLFKLREQEYDMEYADGDAPGVTISFIALNTRPLIECLEECTKASTKELNKEINRVVAHRGQRHHKAMKSYFKKSRSEGAYLIAELYIRHIASFAEEGAVKVSEGYKGLCENPRIKKNKRIIDFIEETNKKAGYTLCDNEKIYIKNPSALSDYEKAVILAVNTGNVSYCSFGAEVEYHARFLTPLAKLPIPFFKSSAYASAIRADMSIDDKELVGPTPYYNINSRLVKRHKKYHKSYM